MVWLCLITTLDFDDCFAFASGGLIAKFKQNKRLQLFKNRKVVEKLIPQDTKFEDLDFVDVDFTKTEMSEVVFKNVNFYNCIFDKTICLRTRFWACFFDNCTFKSVDLNNAYLGAWGGGIENCNFIKCKINKLMDASFLINSTFDNCKIKGVEIRSFYLENVKFTGVIDDFILSKFKEKDIGQYQTPEKTKLVEQKIKKKIGNAFHNPKVVLKNVDFSGARLQFIDFSKCEIDKIKVANDGKHLFISDNLSGIAKQVYEDIEQHWDHLETKSWALRCTENYLKQPNAIICYYDFKHFENEAFADKLMALFQKYV